MNNNKQQPRPENPNNQFSNTEPLTHAQRVAIANTISNNKQNMKLYTEEQVLLMLNVCRDSDLYEHILTLDDILKTETPIELPSDDEVEQIALDFAKKYRATTYEISALIIGAKWMRDKIQGGNNEQL